MVEWRFRLDGGYGYLGASGRAPMTRKNRTDIWYRNALIDSKLGPLTYRDGQSKGTG